MPPSYPPEVLGDAYRLCMATARAHYENFPVASLLVPRRLRKHVAALYAFARHADDIADEGSLDRHTRLHQLRNWRGEFLASLENPSRNSILVALGDTVRRFRLPPQLFLDLLDAFEQDAGGKEYESFDEVLDYCRRSANPVGRLLLHLFDCHDERTTPPADALCTGLQLVNFWQDILIDAGKTRIYVPREDRERFGVSAEDLHRIPARESTRRLIRHEVERTEPFFDRARELFPLVPMRLRLEVAAIWRGGMKILQAISRSGYDPISSRPSLRGRDKLSILLLSPFQIPSTRMLYAEHR